MVLGKQCQSNISIRGSTTHALTIALNKSNVPLSRAETGRGAQQTGGSAAPSVLPSLWGMLRKRPSCIIALPQS